MGFGCDLPLGGVYMHVLSGVETALLYLKKWTLVCAVLAELLFSLLGVLFSIRLPYGVPHGLSSLLDLGVGNLGVHLRTYKGLGADV